MENKILTAEEQLKKYYREGSGAGEEEYRDLEECLIEFAKLHVKAAIKMCIEEAPSGSSTDTVSYEDVVEALTDCYPLTNIK